MTRLRMLLLVAVSVLCLVAAGGYVVWTRSSATEAAAAGAPAEVGAAEIMSGPRVVFRNSALGDGYGRLGLVRLSDPAGPRALGTISCERVYATTSSGVCVTASRAVTPTYGVSTLGADLQPTSSSPLVGLPSRARLSADGSLVTTTTFVSGHSYAQTSFSTETVIRRDGKSLDSLEKWRTTLPDGTPLDAVDRNYWGITFASDDDHFYATVASGGQTWLVHGSMADQTLRALRNDAECPSLSPDGTRVAYKKRLGNPKPGVWRLAVLDLASDSETLLAETRNVDDQVEWLDDSAVLYGLPRTGSEATIADVWRVPADGSGDPDLFIPQASSPAVVRR